MNVRELARERQLGALLGYLAAAFGAAALGGVFTARSVRGWYGEIDRPRWNPPDRLFGPVWTALYIQMALAAWLVHRGVRKRPERADVGKQALRAWSAQLALNVLWSAVFFGRRSIGGGALVIAPLWALIATTAALAARVTRLGALLLVPYVAWTTFALALNFRIWQLNRRG